MTNKKDQPVCDHDLNWTEEEEDALVWLQDTLQSLVTQCDPAGRLSFIAHAAISKAINKAHDLHDKVHELEMELMEAEALVTGMAGLPQRKGLVKKGDLN